MFCLNHMQIIFIRTITMLNEVADCSRTKHCQIQKEKKKQRAENKAPKPLGKMTFRECCTKKTISCWIKSSCSHFRLTTTLTVSLTFDGTTLEESNPQANEFILFLSWGSLMNDSVLFPDRVLFIHRCVWTTHIVQILVPTRITQQQRRAETNSLPVTLPLTHKALYRGISTFCFKFSGTEPRI